MSTPESLGQALPDVRESQPTLSELPADEACASADLEVAQPGKDGSGSTSPAVPEAAEETPTTDVVSPADPEASPVRPSTPSHTSGPDPALSALSPGYWEQPEEPHDPMYPEAPLPERRAMTQAWTEVLCAERAPDAYLPPREGR